MTEPLPIVKDDADYDAMSAPLPLWPVVLAVIVAVIICRAIL